MKGDDLASLAAKSSWDALSPARRKARIEASSERGRLAARRAVTVEGVAYASVTDACRALGISRPTFYRRFPIERP